MSSTSSESATQFKSFVTESELEEKRKVRQAEWDKVRKADDPIEAPEEVVDTRSLYDKLQEQKQKKDDEYDETQKLRNQVQGLGEDETDFLDFVSKRKTELDQAREDENESVLREYREAVVARTALEEKTEKKNPKPQVTKSAKSQQALLAGVVKRKSRGDGESSDKKQKTSANETSGNKNEVSETIIERDYKLPRVIAVLPGLGAYSNSSDSDSSSSDAESGNDHRHRAKVVCKQASGH